MLDLADIQGYEFFRPLVAGWLGKIQGAFQGSARKKWKEVADECLMFYARSAAAMWDPDYGKKFWRNIKAPKFRITVNKAYEYVAVFGPNLIWDIPRRTVKPKRQLQIPPELFGGQEQIFQAIQQQAQQEHASDTLRAHLLEQWLNYTPREMPGGGLEHHNELAVIDAMLVGRGCLWPQLYNFPGSQHTLTGCFRRHPFDLVIDPDFKTLQQAKWIAQRHIQPYWEVERRFKLPPGSLKNKASLETSWHYAELKSRESAVGERQSGQTSDLVIWYEVWSKLGVGARLTGMPDFLKNHLEELVGDYAYLAICPDCPYPLNCPADKIRMGATDADVKNDFEWPIPFWKDDRWPVAILDFYPDPESAWPVPPLAPALGELKFLNFLIPWLCNRIYSSSRDFWAVAGSQFDEYRKTLEDGDDQVVFPVPSGVDDVRKQVMTLQQPETRADAWKIVELVSDLFDKRTGLVEFAYGQNAQGTQDRTAETTKARAQAVGVRPEYMQKKVVAWQGDAATMEGYLTQRFIQAGDTLPLMGQAGGMLWQQYIENQDDEVLFRQMDYTIEASSIRRPNRDKDMADFNEMMDRFVPLIQAYGQLTGDFTPANGLLQKFGELKDMDMVGIEIPAKDPNDPQVQLQQQMQQAEAAKTMAEAHKAMSEAQNNPAELKAQELQMEQQNAQQELQMDMAKLQAELQAKMAELQLKIAEKQADIQMKREEHQQDMQFKVQEGQVDLAVKREQGAQQIAMGNQQLRQSEQQHQQAMQHQEQQTQTKVKSTEETTKAKVQATKAIAKAKPKPTGKK